MASSKKSTQKKVEIESNVESIIDAPEEFKELVIQVERSQKIVDALLIECN